MNTLEVLKAARARIADPAHWTQKAYARDRNGIPVQPTNAKATCWCALGALCVVVGSDDVHVMEDPIEAFYAAELRLRAAGNYSVIGLNDWNRTTHADMLATFDKAIAAEEAAL